MRFKYMLKPYYYNIAKLIKILVVCNNKYFEIRNLVNLETRKE